MSIIHDHSRLLLPSALLLGVLLSPSDQGLALSAGHSDPEILSRALLWISQEKYQAARELLESMLATAQDSVLVEVHYHLAICYLKQGEWNKAEKALDHLSGIESRASGIAYLRAFLLLRTQKYDESLALILSYIQSNPDDGAARKILGLDYFMLGKPDAAESELKRATDLAPNDFEAHYYLGRLYFTRNNMLLALETFKKAIQLEPTSVKAYNHLGQTYEGLAQYAVAESAYLKAIELEQQQTTGSEWPAFNLGALYVSEGRAHLAVQFLRQALARRPGWSECKAKLAAALSAIGEYDQALALLREAVQLKPQNATARYQLAQLLTKLRRTEEARQHYMLFEKLPKP